MISSGGCKFFSVERNILRRCPNAVRVKAKNFFIDGTFGGGERVRDITAEETLGWG